MAKTFGMLLRRMILTTYVKVKVIQAPFYADLPPTCVRFPFFKDVLDGCIGLSQKLIQNIKKLKLGRIRIPIDQKFF